MMIYSIIGLILNVLGTIILFIFGISPVISEKGESCILIEGADISEQRKYKIYKLISKIGLLVIVFGSILQLIDLVNSNSPVSVTTSDSIMSSK